jgi:hypothetical protein
MVARAGDKVEEKLQVQALVARKFKPLSSGLLPLVSLAPRFLANERAEVFVCDWAPLDGNSHQTSPRLASTVSVHIDPCNKPLALQRPATTMDPGTQGTPKTRSWFASPTTPCFPCAFLSWGAWSQIEGSQLSGVLVSSPQLVMFSLVQVKATPGCTEQPGSCAPEERISGSFQKCLRADPSSLLEKY